MATLPRRFRTHFGSDMVEVFDSHYREARRRGARAAAGLTARATLDVLRTGLAERRAPSFFPDQFNDEPPRSGDNRVRTLLYDLRHAVRGALKRPIFTALVVGTLALGIGANTAIFTVVNSVVLRPLPFDAPEELVRVLGVFEPESGFEFARFPLSIPEYVDYRTQATQLDDVALYGTRGASITGQGQDAERAMSGLFTSNAFALLGVRPEMGRVFTEEEGRPDATPVVLLRAGYWQARFAGDPDILGKDIVIDGRPHTIVGVMPDSFEFPDPRVQLWRPLRVDPAEAANRQAHSFNSLGRLAAGATFESAATEMETLMAGWADEYPDHHVGHYLYLRPLQADTVREARPALLLLLAASGFVLLIVCANVASILLARGEERTREMAIRSAVGAPRRRLAQLVLGESMVLSTIGGTLGVTLAWFGVRVLLDLQAAGMPRANEIRLDAPVLGFAIATTLLTSLLFSLAPALHASSLAPRQHLLEGDVRTSASGRRLLLRRGLVAAEVALSFVLVMGAGLMIRSFSEITHIDPGFDSEGVLIAGVSLSATEYPEDADILAFVTDFSRRAAALPGVHAAAGANAVPMYTGVGTWDFEIEGKESRVDAAMAFNGDFSPVQAGFLDLMGARLLSGRFFDDTDTADAQIVGLINAELAERFFADEDPLGQRIRVAPGDSGPPMAWMTIVGVVESLRTNGLDQDPAPAYYSVLPQLPATAGSAFRFTALAVKADDDPSLVVQPLRSLLQEMNASLPLIGAQPMREVIADTVAPRRFTTRLLTIFAVVALILGASGIYGVLAYSVAQRTREIGIRKALGARPGQVLQMIVRQGMVPVVVGLVAGAAGSVLVGRAIEGLLHGVSPLDPVTYLGVTAVLGIVAIAACFAPAIRAVRLDPLRALRTD
jgi:putative ABC transport system permease protein